MKISELTRRDLLDAIGVEKFNWYGRLEESEFLSRLFDLNTMDSYDSRFENFAQDIWQHRVNNYDWEDDWLFTDDRINLMGCDDEVLLRFLCETIHPVVRSDVTESERICQLYNSYLNNDGYEIVEKTRMSNKPIYTGRFIGTSGTPGIKAAKETLQRADLGYVAQQITRMETAVQNDPGLAIGTAKELIETCCKTILQERKVTIPRKNDLLGLMKLTSKELQLSPADIPDSAKASRTIKILLNNLATITQGIAELRNQYGTGHGKDGRVKGLQVRHAKLAVGSASTLAVFLMETHQERQK